MIALLLAASAAMQSPSARPRDHLAETLQQPREAPEGFLGVHWRWFDLGVDEKEHPLLKLTVPFAKAPPCPPCHQRH